MLIEIVLVLIILGFLLWLVETYVVMAAPFKQIIRAVVVIGAVLWVLVKLGIISQPFR